MLEGRTEAISPGKIAFDRSTLNSITPEEKKKNSEKRNETRKVNRGVRKKTGVSRRRRTRDKEELRNRRREIDADGSFPWDVRGNRVPWRAAGRIHGVFPVVLRCTVVPARSLCAVGVARYTYVLVQVNAHVRSFHKSPDTYTN